MHRRTLLASTFGLLAAACGTGTGTPAPTHTATPHPFPTRDPREAAASRITEADMMRLIYWDSIFGGWDGGPSGEQLRILDDAIYSFDDRYIPYLLDLVALPNPYAFELHDQLVRRIGDSGNFYVFGWHEQRGFLSPEDDTIDYLRFKHRLVTSLQPEMGRFIEPDKPRTISAQEILWGGVVVDGIPPLNDPKMETLEQAALWAFDTDQVIGVVINGEARAYPRRIIDWHEMVNDTVGGVPVSLAYCTLCNSAILYDGRHNGQVYRFGTSGMLYRSNKLMYDTTTNSLWEQFTGEPVWGDLVGTGVQLEILPVVHTSLGEWRRLHPDTKILSLETGFIRDYGPGVAYAEYWASPAPIFPVPGREGPVDAKSRVFAVRLEGETVGFPIETLEREGFMVEPIAGRDIVVLRTLDGSGGRAYDLAGQSLTAWDHVEGVATTADGRTWLLGESALLAEDGAELLRVPGHNAFWFAISNHTPNGRLAGE